MRAQCIQAVVQAIGRALTAPETKDIEERITRTMRQLARRDPQAWMAKSQHDRLTEAADEAGKQIIAEAQRKQQNEALTISAHARIYQYMQAQQNRGMGALEALDRTIAFSADGKSNTQSVEYQAKSIENLAVSQMLTAMEAGAPKWFGLFENLEGVTAIIREIFGEKSGNADAAKGAKEWDAVASALRERKNRAGGDVHKLEDWRKPQHHSQLLVAKAGKDTYVSDVLPWVDREHYYNEDGSRMSDAQLSDFLGHAWQTISTGGANKLTPGQFQGSGARANRGSESRQIHFKDADSFIKYQAKYGERSLYEVLVGHIAAVAKDVALTETYGPNPDHTFRYFRDSAMIEAKKLDPVKSTAIDEQARKTENLYNEVSGKTQPVGSERLARNFDTLRSWLISCRLGSSVITSFSDDATLHQTGQVNHLPPMRLLANELAALNPANRMELRLAHRAGLGLNTMISTVNRFGESGLGHAFSKRLANATLRASGLNAMTDARRRGFGVTMMGAIGGVVKDHPNLGAIDPHDNAHLLSKGITEENFAVWKAAQQENWGGGNDTMLTPESIFRIPDAALAHITVPTGPSGQLKLLGAIADPTTLREQAATKLLGAVLEETDMAVIEPGARERAFTSFGLQRGTWRGELMRSAFLFKSFPLAMISKHWARGMAIQNTGGRAAYLATLLATTTVLGMASLQVEQLIQGRDPRDMNLLHMFGGGSGKNWMAAMLKGGSLGIYGDFLFSDSTQYGNSPIAMLTGPVFGEVEDIVKLTQGNMLAYLQGKRTHTGADLVKFFRSNLPGASIWYEKGALDHLIFQRLQEYFSPGYLARMRQRAQKEFGQTYYAPPGELPQRAPDMSKAMGQ